jgi:hypothetical protein
MVALFCAASQRRDGPNSERLFMVTERFATNEPSPLQTIYSLGRALLIRCVGPLGGPEPEETVAKARRAHIRIVVVDATHADYADSDGLRWLLAMQSGAAEEGIEVRIAACEGGNIWRNVVLLRAGLPLYSDVQTALHGAPRSSAGMPIEGKEAAHA